MCRLTVLEVRSPKLKVSKAEAPLKALGRTVSSPFPASVFFGSWPLPHHSNLFPLSHLLLRLSPSGLSPSFIWTLIITVGPP